jgi:hypothetical protein
MSTLQNPRIQHMTRLTKKAAALAARKTVYNVWQHMRASCNRPTASSYAYVGALGIGILSHWDDFDRFYASVGDRPGPEYVFSRKDLTLDYTPGNVEWVDVSTGLARIAEFKQNLAANKAIMKSRREKPITGPLDPSNLKTPKEPPVTKSSVETRPHETPYTKRAPTATESDDLGVPDQTAKSGLLDKSGLPSWLGDARHQRSPADFPMIATPKIRFVVKAGSGKGDLQTTQLTDGSFGLDIANIKPDAMVSIVHDVATNLVTIQLK